MSVWSKVPYWLRGGLLLLVIMGAVNLPLIFLDFFDLCTGPNGEQTSLCNLLILIGFTPGVLLSLINSRFEGYIIAISFIVYFLIGAIVGFIWGIGKRQHLPRPQSMAEVEQRYKEMEE